MNRLFVRLEESSLGAVIVLTILIALVLASAFTYLAYLLSFGVPEDPVPFWQGEIGATSLESLTRIGFTALAVVVGSGAAVIAYRSQRIKERSHARDGETALHERFVSAAAQLGSERASVRIAGVHAMSALASDSGLPALRQQCIDVLCAYLRMPEAEAQTGGPAGSLRPVDPQEFHVRATIQRSLAHHLNRNNPRRWRDADIDLRGAVLHSFSLSEAEVRNLTIAQSLFIGESHFQDTAVAEQVDARDAVFGGNAFFVNARFRGRARFYGASFIGAASFVGATFTSLAWFYDCVFKGSAGFARAEFQATTGFERARFESKTGYLNAKFADCRFTDTQFLGRTRFRKVEFMGPTSFSRAVFEQAVTFGGSHFHDRPSFSGATRLGKRWDGPTLP